ncbi:Clr5 domain-containing protein [Xylariaceae sp. FL0804]|nr:Clr5 domain-containing protein [Xylariaceae sp. FL0804]
MDPSATSTGAELSYRSGFDGIPLHVVERRTEHAEQHSHHEWDIVKPIIWKLYMEDNRPLKLVMRTIAEDYDFHATTRMYKIRFRRWGWRKNRTKDQQRAAVLSGEKTKGMMIRFVRPPELLSDQEVPISISRNYTIDQSGSQRWNCIVLNMSEPTPSSAGQSASVVRFRDAETAYVNTIHQLRSGRIQDAFLCLNRLFDSMTGSRIYLHPKYLTGFWLLCHGVYNACAWINDSGFHLLRELLCFHGQNAAACFQSAGSAAHPVVSLMRSVARMSRDNPGVMKQTFCNAYRAAAESLEDKLGRNHPVVLVTWTDYYWYFNFAVDPARDLTARQQAALLEAEATWGRDADVTICLLHNFVFFLFYCVAEDAQARERLSDLLERTSRRMAGPWAAMAGSFHVQRAHAFATLLQGLFVLQDTGDLGRCREVIGVAVEWLRQCGGSDAAMHAKMLEMDLFTLTSAWEGGKDLRDLTLAFAKPRSADYNDQNPRPARQRPRE